MGNDKLFEIIEELFAIVDTMEETAETELIKKNIEDIHLILSSRGVQE